MHSFSCAESVTSTEGPRNRRPNQKRRPRRYGGPEGGPQQSQSQQSQQQAGSGDRVAARSFSEPRDAKEGNAAQPLPPRDRKASAAAAFSQYGVQEPTAEWPDGSAASFKKFLPTCD